MGSNLSEPVCEINSSQKTISPNLALAAAGMQGNFMLMTRMEKFYGRLSFYYSALIEPYFSRSL